jgi:hypothetical protein
MNRLETTGITREGPGLSFDNTVIPASVVIPSPFFDSGRELNLWCRSYPADHSIRKELRSGARPEQPLMPGKARLNQAQVE